MANINVYEEEISPEEFDEIFRPDYGFYFPLAKKLFLEYGPLFSFFSAAVMQRAHEECKRKACLRRMKGHLESVLSLCHPDFRSHKAFIGHPAYLKTQDFLETLACEFKPVTR